MRAQDIETPRDYYLFVIDGYIKTVWDRYCGLTNEFYGLHETRLWMLISNARAEARERNIKTRG